MTKGEEEFVYARIGMALVSAHRVEFITGQLLEQLQNFDKDVYQITSAEFLEQTEKSKKSIKTLGQIFKLLKSRICVSCRITQMLFRRVLRRLMIRPQHMW